MSPDMGASPDGDRATRASTEPASSLGHTASVPSADTLTISGFIRAMQRRFEERAGLSPDRALFATVATLDGWEVTFAEPVELTTDCANCIVDCELEYWETEA